MDFMSRMTPTQPQPARMPAPESVEPRSQRGGPHHRSRADWLTLGSRIGTNAILVVVALLVAAVAWFMFSAQPSSPSRFVDTKHLQAVFLNTGQVYFGKISSLNSQYLVLNSVYYLQSSGGSSKSDSTANQNVSLVKLGCELHKPYDAMMVNMSEVTFWENLQADGQVAKAVSQYQQQNPNGQNCNNSAPSSSSSNLQNQTSTNKQ